MKTEPYWIEGPWQGKLAIIPRPRGGDWLEDETRCWKRADLDIVVSLSTPDEASQLDLRQEEHLQSFKWTSVSLFSHHRP